MNRAMSFFLLRLPLPLSLFLSASASQSNLWELSILHPVALLALLVCCHQSHRLWLWLSLLLDRQYCGLSNTMHGQNINLSLSLSLSVCVCACVRHAFYQLAYRSDPSTDFYS